MTAKRIDPLPWHWSTEPPPPPAPPPARVNRELLVTVVAGVLETRAPLKEFKSRVRSALPEATDQDIGEAIRTIMEARQPARTTIGIADGTLRELHRDRYPDPPLSQAPTVPIAGPGRWPK